MDEIEVDLNDLAELVLANNYFYQIDENKVLTDDETDEEETDLIESFLAPLTKEGFIISVAALEHLKEELHIVITKKLYLRLLNIVDKFENEDAEILFSAKRYYKLDREIIYKE